jgi:hypothetical protein
MLQTLPFMRVSTVVLKPQLPAKISAFANSVLLTIYQ